ncbi:MAG: DUF7910 domain-containing protein [Bacteroidia bacterium]
MNAKVKYIFFIVLLVLLWLPMLQQRYCWFSEKELNGAFFKPYKPLISIDSVKTLEYQNQLEKYQNSNFGFRAFLIRFKNSINYLVFKELSITDNIAGKDNYIFSLASTERTLGIRYNGKKKNEGIIDRVKFLQQGIENGGGHFMVVIPPSKESIFPELLPSQYNIEPKENTDYNDFIKGYKEKGVPVLDLVSYFKSIKDTSSYPLFTKTGFHWSLYGASLAHDTLIGSMQRSFAQQMLTYQRIAVEVSDTAREPDNDFEGPLNLLFRLGKPPYYYSKFKIAEEKKDVFKPKVIIIGDSFFWQLKNQKVMQKLFSEDSKFWYYFATTSFPIGDVAGVPLHDIDVMKELRSAYYVLLVGNISTMDAFPYGIADYYFNNISTGEVNYAIIELVRGVKDLNKGATDQNTINMITKQICRDAKRTYIMAANGKYICAGGEEEENLVANRDEASDWERFVIYKLESNKVAISSYKNNFLSAELGKKGEITSTRNKIGGWEKFEIIQLGEGMIAFKADNGKYLSLDRRSGQIFASASVIGKDEKFILKQE